MKKIEKRKLALSSTTIRHLDSAHLVPVVGGFTLTCPGRCSNQTCTELCTNTCRTDVC